MQTLIKRVAIDINAIARSDRFPAGAFTTFPWKAALAQPDLFALRVKRDREGKGSLVDIFTPYCFAIDKCVIRLCIALSSRSGIWYWQTILTKVKSENKNSPTPPHPTPHNPRGRVKLLL
ncbi:hypothetical protein ACE1CD_21755 [Aerosakkonema sp. BLCC-F183]|uniref:hypothetical protein n=1 Tax=Aerosakkonema sp. BLCC-F183 TaxID=3342834 RepID=UPI0035BB3A20